MATSIEMRESPVKLSKSLESDDVVLSRLGKKSVLKVSFLLHAIAIEADMQ
jgi:hypothetical protein